MGSLGILLLIETVLHDSDSRPHLVRNYGAGRNDINECRGGYSLAVVGSRPDLSFVASRGSDLEVRRDACRDGDSALAQLLCSDRYVDSRRR